MGRRHRPRDAVVEEAGASHLSSVGSASEASAGNRVGAGGARIQANRTEQPRVSGRPGASAVQSKLVMPSLIDSHSSYGHKHTPK